MDETRTKLRKLRDKLAFEAARARAHAGTPTVLADRLQSALEQINVACRLAMAPPQSTPAAAAISEEVIEDAIVEAHVALHDWERLLEHQSQRTKPPLASADRRQHVRQETNVSVRLLRHAMTVTESGVAFESATVNRPARNVSRGGIFVSAPASDLPEVRVGSVLHVAIDTTLGATLAFRTRAVVERRDANGFGLRWMEDSDRARAAIESLLAALSRVRTGAGAF